jgi:hypothetical protein
MEKQIGLERRPGEIDSRCVLRIRLSDEIIDDRLKVFA